MANRNSSSHQIFLGESSATNKIPMFVLLDFDAPPRCEWLRA